MSFKPVGFAILLSLLALGLCALAAFLADKVLPYSFDDVRRFRALALMSAVRSYVSVGDTNFQALYKTNSYGRTFPFATNIIVAGVPYQTVIAMEDIGFRQRGFVACTTNDAVWIGRDGKAHVINFRQRRWE